MNSIPNERRLACDLCETAHIRELERSNERLEEFAQIASHDLRAPLRAMLSLIEWVRDDLTQSYGELPENIAADLEELSNQGRRMRKLLSDLLEYSRVGSTSATTEAFDPTTVIEDCVRLVSVPEEFAVDVIQPLPEIECSPVEFSIVMRNLLANSIKHHDRREGRITVEGWKDAGLGYFRVSDDGPGIDEAFSSKIFEMFQSLNSSRGNGIGLGIVKKVIETYGGTARVEKNPAGRGAAFVVSFPLVAAAKRQIGDSLMAAP